MEFKGRGGPPKSVLLEQNPERVWVQSPATLQLDQPWTESFLRWNVDTGDLGQCQERVAPRRWVETLPHSSCERKPACEPALYPRGAGNAKGLDPK